MAVAEEDTGQDLVEADFMAEVLEGILPDSLVDAALVVDGMEEAVTGEDVAITRTEDMPIPTTGFVGILTTIPTTLTGIGQPSVIPMAGVTEFGCHIIEGEGYFLKSSHHNNQNSCFIRTGNGEEYELTRRMLPAFTSFAAEQAKILKIGNTRYYHNNFRTFLRMPLLSPRTFSIFSACRPPEGHTPSLTSHNFRPWK
jgi:hypothetical protein